MKENFTEWLNNELEIRKREGRRITKVELAKVIGQTANSFSMKCKANRWNDLQIKEIKEYLSKN